MKLSKRVGARLWGSLLGLWLLTGHTAEPNAAPDGYHIKAGDVLHVAVWRETDLNLDVLVRPDGGISLPLVGDVQAAGRTVDNLRGIIGDRLEQFIPEPAVSVSVKEIRGNNFHVIGKVARPGVYVLSGQVDVIQALSIAGGTTTFAKLNDIQILRRNDETQIAIPFRYGDVERGKNLQQNILLQSGDVVVVP